jgi:hypothetical protein
LNANININSKKQNINILAYYCEKFKLAVFVKINRKTKNNKFLLMIKININSINKIAQKMEVRIKDTNIIMIYFV